MVTPVRDGPFLQRQTDWSDWQLRCRLESGAVRRLVKGVYVAAEIAITLEVRAQALQLVVPPRAVVCRSTAAWLDGIDVLTVADGSLPLIELAVSEGTAAIRRPGVVCYVEWIRPEDVRVVGGIRATTPLRTVTDLARWLPRYQAIGLVDAALRLGVVTRDDLIAEEERWFGFKGVRQLRELTRFADPRAESPRESWMRLLHHDAGFPDLQPQVPVDRGPGLEPYRLDLADRDLMFGEEYDGQEFHPPWRLAQDERRRSFIRGEAWRIVVARRGDLERPQRFVDAVGEFLTPVRPARRGLRVVTGFAPRSAA